VLRPYTVGDSVNKSGDLWFVGVANDVGDAGEGGEFFRGALRVAASDDDFGGGILGVDFADSVASLGVGGGSDGTGVKDYDFGGGRVSRRGKSEIAELAFEGGAVGLGGAATELVDVEGGHFFDEKFHDGDRIPVILEFEKRWGKAHSQEWLCHESVAATCFVMDGCAAPWWTTALQSNAQCWLALLN